MSDVSVRGMSKTFRGRVGAVLSDLDLEVPAGEMLVLLGPSGCGKTTTLRCLAGLEQPDAGLIKFGDRIIFDQKKKTFVPPHRRDIGLVFQSFALWPHLTVRRNIEFPLRTRRRAKSIRRPAVEAALGMVELPPVLLDKRPHQLSGGQQQRVSLARALVAEPAVVLFDEPLSSLDAQLRVQVRSELHELHRRLGFTGVYVTHDLSEALALGTRVAVMAGGRIQQIGPPSEVFDTPNSVLVAKLFGYSPVRFDKSPSGSSTEAISSAVYVRPDRLRVVTPDSQVPPGSVRATGLSVGDVAYLGSVVEFTIQDGPDIIRVPVPVGGPLASIRPGDRIDLEASVTDLRMLGGGPSADAVVGGDLQSTGDALPVSSEATGVLQPAPTDIAEMVSPPGRYRRGAGETSTANGGGPN